MFSNLTQIKEYMKHNTVTSITRYPTAKQWTLSLNTARKKRFIQAALATQLMADSVVQGIPVIIGSWPG